MKKFISGLVFFCIALSLSARTPREALDALLESRAIDPERTAVYVYDLDADYLVAAHRIQQPVIPASVMKCVTTAALSTVLPYSDSLKTRVYLQGKTKDGVFSGVLQVKGAGDPSLGDGRHKHMPDFIPLIVEALIKEGINEFKGDISIDDSFFAGAPFPSSWEAGDLSQAYGTGCHAFNFERNASGKKSVTNPGAVFRNRLIPALEAAGISFSLETHQTDKGEREKLLIEYASPRADELMRSCMFRSDNLYAEAFLRLFGIANGSDGSVEMSADIAMQHWDALSYPMAGVRVIDGSGLSRDNSLTAEFLGMVLREKKDDAFYASFFPLAGEEGTVKGFLADTPLQGRMALKTGSMSGIQSYAGYMLDEDFVPTHAVVVMANGLKDRSAFRAALSRFFLSVFEER